MATKLIMRSIMRQTWVGLGEPVPLISGGTPASWRYSAWAEAQGASVVTDTVASVNGATNGIEVGSGSTIEAWVSDPVDQDVTISGAITFNLWAHESSMNANAAVNCRIWKVDGKTGAFTEIIKTTRVTEVGTASAVNNFNETPGAGVSLNKGDRLMCVVFFDDAGTMVTGFTLTFSFNAAAGANGDSYVSFNETFGFLEFADAAGSQLFLTSAAGPAVGSDDEREMWTSRGGSVTTTDATATVNGLTSPITIKEGGVPIEWYSRRLNAFTLDNAVAFTIRGLCSATAANLTLIAELAVVNNDGTGAVIVGSCGCGTGTTASNAAFTNGTERTANGVIGVDGVAVTDGQRLRLRLYIDDGGNEMVSGQSLTIYFNGSIGGSGDSYVQLSQTVSEYTPPATKGPPFANERRTSRRGVLVRS